MIHVIWGEDAFSIAAEERQIVDALVPTSWRSVNLTVFDGAAASVPEVLGAARTPSFFGDRLVVVRDCHWFSPAARKKKDADAEGGPGDEGAKGEGAKGEGAKGEGAKGEGAKGEGVKGEGARAEGGADPVAARVLAETLKEGLPPGCNLLLVVPRTLNKTLGTTKALLEGAAKGHATVKEFPGPDPFKPDRTIGWAVTHARTVGQGIDREAAELLVGRLGQDKYMLDNELKKLASYAGERSVQVQDVAALSPPGDSDVFELLEAVTAGRPADAIVHVRRLVVHDHPLKIVAAMVTFVRTWHQIKLMTERRTSADDIGRAVKWHPYRVQKAQEALRNWTSGHLARALEAIAEAEHALKGSGYPDVLVMERLLAKLATL